MSLIKLTSDKCTGYAHSPVYIEATSVASIEEIVDAYNRTNNRTTVRLNTGETMDVREHVTTVAQMVNEQTATPRLAEAAPNTGI